MFLLGRKKKGRIEKEWGKVKRKKEEKSGGRKWAEWIKKYEYFFCILSVGVDFGDVVVVVAALLGDVLFVYVIIIFSNVYPMLDRMSLHKKMFLLRVFYFHFVSEKVLFLQKTAYNEQSHQWSERRVESKE